MTATILTGRQLDLRRDIATAIRDTINAGAPSYDSVAETIAQIAEAYTADPDKTLTFPTAATKMLAAVAMDREWEREKTRSRIVGILNRYERPGRIIELDDGCYVAEIIDTDPDAAATWGAIVNNRRDHGRFYTLDEALLRAVELRNGGRQNDEGHVYAARMLGVTKPTGETAS